MTVTWCAPNVLSHDLERSIYCSITQTMHMLTTHLLYPFLMKAALVQTFAYLLASDTCHRPHLVTVNKNFTFFYPNPEYFNPEAQPTPPFTPDLCLCTTALNKLTSYQQDCQATMGSPLLRLSLPLRAPLERDNFTAEGHSPLVTLSLLLGGSHSEEWFVMVESEAHLLVNSFSKTQTRWKTSRDLTNGI